MAKRLTRNKGKDYVFLPDHLDQVRAIAMHGCTDDEMAATFGIPARLLQKWKAFYPSFKEAIDKGRTLPDAMVVAALHKKAIGYSRDKDVAFPGGRGREPVVLTVTEHFEPDTPAIKYWLNNRQPDRWRDSSHVAATGGRKGDAPIGMKDETKHELMSSILGLIRPKPDGDPADRA